MQSLPCSSKITYLAKVCLLLLIYSTHLAALPPIIFVTQPPNPADFATTNATFANHMADMYSIPRGGDLYIRYQNGTLKNLTNAAGYGNSGFQGASSIAVRDPAVHWSGQKVIFSMVIGAPTAQYQVKTFYWQLYEITNLGQNQTPVISKVPNQPQNYNNIMPIYGTDDRIIFVSDQPRAAQAHHYPQRDEYESTPTNTGLWSLNPVSGNLFQLDHAPSGDFDPIIDSFGRILFIRWDHLQRDQQNRCSQPYFQAFNYSSEAANASILNQDQEVFPEPRADCENGPANLNNHSFNHFLPWQINEDGTEIETINHVGRHELVGYLSSSFNDDDNIEEFYGQYSRNNQSSVEHFFHIKEDPLNLGTYFAVNAPEFGTHAAGQIFKINGSPTTPADQMLINYITHPDTSFATDSPSLQHSGLYRHPLPLSDGSLIATHTTSTRADINIGSAANPQSRYEFRLKNLSKVGSYFKATSNVTSGITKTVSFWNPDTLVSYNAVTMWELQAVELRARNKPARRAAKLPAIEKSVFDNLSVNLADFRSYLMQHDLALVVSRNVTTRDNLDHQQPRNIKIFNSATETINNSGKVYEVAHMQFFQGDLIRGYGIHQNGRRVLAQPLHSSLAHNIPNSNAPAGSVKIASDGSMAALVPARRALTWQLTNNQGHGVVRERVWLTFQPGEIRVCASCHGVNSKDQVGRSEPQNSPLALAQLLNFWKGLPNDQQPAFNFTVRGIKPSKRKVRLSVSSQDSSASNKNLQIRIKVGKFQCPQLLEINTDQSGNANITKRFPASAKGKRITFELLYLGNQLTRKRLLIPGSAAKNAKPNKICERVL